MLWLFTTFLIPYLLLPPASCLPLVPPLAYTSMPVTKTVHSTNPQVIFAPELVGEVLWEKKVYKSPIDGRLHSFYLANNWGSDPTGDQIRRMETGVRGAHEICLFGAPRSQLSSLAPAQQVCLDAVCTAIDIDQVYATTAKDSPARLWCSGSINPHRYHRVQLRLLEPSRGWDIRHISFHHMEYVTQETPPGSGYQLGIGETSSNSTIHSTSARITYSPPYYQYDQKKYNPWDKVIYTNEHGHRSSFFRTSNWLNQPIGRDNRRATTVFKGSSVYIYGAPPSEVRRLGQQGFGKLQITLDTDVEPIDTEEIYLNIDPLQDNLEVLIYSNERLDPWQDHHLQVRLLEGTSPLPHIVKTLTLAKIIVTEVKRPVAPQIPGTKHYAEVRKAEVMVYRPCAALWWSGCVRREDIWLHRKYVMFGWQEHTFYSATTEQAETEKTSATFYVPGDTTSLVLKGPPRYMFTRPFAKQVVDIDGVASYPLDVEQAYLNIDLDQEEGPVVIFSLDNIPHSLDTRKVTLRFTQNQLDYDFEEPTELSIEQAEYVREVIPPPAPKPTPLPPPPPPPASPPPNSSNTIRLCLDVLMAVFRTASLIIASFLAVLLFLAGIECTIGRDWSEQPRHRYPGPLQNQSTQPTRVIHTATAFTPSNPPTTSVPSPRRVINGPDTLHRPLYSVEQTEGLHEPQEQSPRPPVNERQPLLPRGSPSTRSQGQSLSAMRSACPSYSAHLLSPSLSEPPPPYDGVRGATGLGQQSTQRGT